jgi:hypothetical protein
MVHEEEEEREGVSRNSDSRPRLRTSRYSILNYIGRLHSQGSTVFETTLRFSFLRFVCVDANRSVGQNPSIMLEDMRWKIRRIVRISLCQL